MNDSLEHWAKEEFGHATLGDARRVDRLLKMGQRAAESPSGVVAKVFTDPADLDAAYDWLQSTTIEPGAVAAAMAVAAARRARGLPYVLAATDGSSYALSDKSKQFGTGPVGTRTNGARGDKIHTVLLMTPTGVPLGIVEQHNWVRSDRKAAKSHSARKTHEKETQIWLDARERTRTVLAEHAPEVPVWLQHDREADAWPIVLDAAQAAEGEFTTIRAAWNRCLWDQDPADVGVSKVRATLERCEMQGTYSFEVPATPTQSARTATMQVRFAEVTLRLRDQWTDAEQPATVMVVQAVEVGPLPGGVKRLEWLLLTTWPVSDFASACEVVRAYTFRWRIEEFHRALKTAYGEVEDIGLSAHARRAKWALILSAVAVRLLRWMYLSRETPTLPASEALSSGELEALQDLAPTRVPEDVATLTVSDAVFHVALLGGYRGTRNQMRTRPPGVQVLARGLRRVWTHLVGLRGRKERLRRRKSGRDAGAAEVPK